MARPDNSQTNLPLVVSTPWNKTAWKSLKLNVLASDRTDLEVGQGYLAKDSSGRSVVSYNFRDPKWGSKDSLIAKPFLNGFDVNANSNYAPLGVKLDSSTYNSTGASCYVSSFNNARLANVFAYFVIFDPKNVNFLFSEGFIEQNMLAAVIKIEVPTKNITSFDTYVAGVSSFNFDTTTAISFASTLDNKFVLQLGPVITTTINYIGYHYLIIGYGECSKCNGHPILHKGACIAKCPFGTVMKGGECVDVICPANSAWDGANCVCNPGFNNYNDICIRCSAEFIFNPTRGCVCKDGLYRINGTCGVCPVSTVYDGVNNCVCPPGSISDKGICKMCPPGTLPRNGACVCDGERGYFEINGNCQSCPDGTEYDQYMGKCSPKCGANSYFNGTNCVCNPGYFVLNGVCDFCRPGTIYNVTQSKCVAACDLNEIWDGFTCQCRSGLYRIQGICDSCQPNSRWNGTGCQCIEGFYSVNCKCIQCPPNRVWNHRTQSCEAASVCGVNERLVNGLCICNDGCTKIDGKCVLNGDIGGLVPAGTPYCKEANAVFIWNGCYCKSGFTYIRGACVPGSGSIAPISCAAGYVLAGNVCVLDGFNPTTPNNTNQVCADSNAYYIAGICICKPNFVYSNGYCVASSGTVTPACPENSFWDGSKCICNYGSIYVSGVCVSKDSATCAPGFVLNKGVCVPVTNPSQCSNGLIWTGVACSCPTGSVMTNGVCGPIVCNNGVLLNGVCVCNPGSANVNGKCIRPTPCPNNAYWNGQSCVCRTGFTMRNGACAPVPTVSCGPNSFFNGIQCVCNPGYFKNTNNICQSPPNGTYWNGQVCLPVGTNPQCLPGTQWNGVYCASESSATCGTNGYWNGYTCICNPGSFMVNGYCATCQKGTYYNGYTCASSVPGVVQCPSNKFHNGQSCVCIAGYFEIDGNCITCPNGLSWNGGACVTADAPSKCSQGQQYIYNSCSCLPGLFTKGSTCSITA